MVVAGLAAVLAGMAAVPTPASGQERAAAAPAPAAANCDIQVSDSSDGGMAAWKIVTPAVTWYYQKAAGAFSSAVASDGRDWIGWGPAAQFPQFAGEYRGIGQLHDNWFHPGGTQAASRIVSQSAQKVTLESTHVDADGTWIHQVEIFPTHVRDTFTSVGNRSWWFLYEGTPGGEKPDGSLIDGGKVYRGTAGANPTITNFADRWDQDLGANGYVVFAAPSQNRSIFFTHGQGGGKAGSKSDGRMTIFGFGRDLADGSQLNGPGHSFTYGLLETADATTARNQISTILAGGSGGCTSTSTTTPPPTTLPSTTSTTRSGGGGSNPPPSSGFAAVSPTRLLDTRLADQGPALTARQPRTLTVRNRAGVPDDAGTVVLNVTAVNASRPAWVRVWASDQPEPSTSSINLVAGDTVPNLVTTKVGGDGTIKLMVSDGSADLVADVVGYYADSVATGGYHPVVPRRAYDSREIGGGQPLGPAGTVDVDVAAALGVGAAQMAGVALNVTVTGPTAGGYASVFPAGGTVPLVSNLNFAAGQTVANAVVSGVSGGRITVYNATGSSHVVVDIMGWYETGSGGARFHSISPARALDTRPDPVVGGTSTDALVATSALGVDPAASAVVANVTVADATAGAFITAWPSGATRPFTSIQNTVAGTTRANQAMVQVGSGQSISVYNSTGAVQVIVDVVGYFR